MMMNILFVESGVYGGGSFESLYQYIKKIDRLNYNPYVFFTNKTKYFDKFEELGVICYSFDDFLYTKHDNFVYNLVVSLLIRIKLLLNLFFPFASIRIEKIFHYKSINNITRIIKTHNIHIVHTNNQVNRDLYAIIAAKSNRLPCVSHLRSFFSKGFNKIKARYVNSNVQKYIAYSHSISSYWNNNGLNHDKLIIIHNAIECEKVFPLDLHSKYNINKSIKLIGIVGRIIPVRGHFFLVEAIRQLAKLKIDFRVFIVGNGELKLIEKLKKTIDKYNLSENFIFTGKVDDAKQLIAGLDILVMPYSIEPFGRTLLEAWCMKTPVIISNVGFINEVATDGEDAVFVDFGNVEQLSKKIYELLSNKELYNHISNNAFMTCVEKYSITKYRYKLESIYNEVNKNMQL